MRAAVFLVAILIMLRRASEVAAKYKVWIILRRSDEGWSVFGPAGVLESGREGAVAQALHTSAVDIGLESF